MSSRADVAAMIASLHAGRVTREQASVWAERFQGEACADSVVEDALDLLVGIDSLQIDANGLVTGYLFDLDQLDHILAQLRAGS